MPVSTFTTDLTHTTNGNSTRRAHTARAIAARLAEPAAELAGFLSDAELPANLDLDVAANLTAAEGLLVRAIHAIEAAGPA